jgi:hypothetical protein
MVSLCLIGEQPLLLTFLCLFSHGFGSKLEPKKLAFVKGPPRNWRGPFLTRLPATLVYLS